MNALDLTLVIDIGKSRAKLLLVNSDGDVVQRHERDNASVPSPLDYPALDVQGLQHWMAQTLRSSVFARQCQRVIASTHGAAFVALGDNGLAWEPLDYEFDALALEPDRAMAQAYQQARDPFAHTLAPDLPAGLNAARQLWWLQHRHPKAWALTRCLLPYPQYWAWVLSGVAASERSSLGCHTQLWSPPANGFSALAGAMGWSRLFAPLRSAWEVLGLVQPQIASEWGLPPTCQVHVGVHDSNACLARYLANTSGEDGIAKSALTLVSSGTWTVLMAPGAPPNNLNPACDMLGNVDVLGRCTPTARFMGGREFAFLLDGADPAAASRADLQQVIASETQALPCFTPQGGPFARQSGVLQNKRRLLFDLPSQALPDAGLRAALAALYCAQITAWLVQRLWQGAACESDKSSMVVVEGPLAHNPIYLTALQGLLPEHNCQASTDILEGTARGAWLLAQGLTALTSSQPVFLTSVPKNAVVGGLTHYHAAWLEQLERRVANAVHTTE